MPLSVLVRSTTGGDTRLTFDGMQSVVLGRGASCDVRLPDSSVSHRHASLRAQGMDFVLVDEGSSNGTFVGGVRVAPRTSRIVRSGDVVRLGRVWIELRIDQSPVTRDVGSATRELALALVSQALAAMGTDLTTKVRVLEGRDQGAALALAEEGRIYTLGRGPECDLPVADADASREHATVVRHGGEVRVRDLGAKNGTWLGEATLPGNRDVVWRPTLMLRIGRTVLALEEPVSDALARIESIPDEPLANDDVGPAPLPSTPAVEPPSSVAREAASAAPMAVVPTQPAAAKRRPRGGWAPADLMVMAAAIGVLALSLAGLIYLLRG